eukprot:c9246_g1_i1.p1 GENE.c9246_g1_i1~~c9246_g1_i1.p1  ORF type:complete len:519 (-),score=128.68 c9246_g1_i1:81-1637(-)
MGQKPSKQKSTRKPKTVGLFTLQAKADVLETVLKDAQAAIASAKVQDRPMPRAPTTPPLVWDGSHDYNTLASKVVGKAVCWDSKQLLSLIQQLVSARHTKISLELLLEQGKRQSITPFVLQTGYTFISHKHSHHENRLAGIGNKWKNLAHLSGPVWIDLVSMFQGTWNGYDFESHTKPTVTELHNIIRNASRAEIWLDGQDTDPLTFDQLLQSCEMRFTVATTLAEYPLSAYGVHLDCELLRSSAKAFDRLFALAHDLPRDEYFGRLWCYVERMGCRACGPDQIRGKSMTGHVELLNVVVEMLRNMFEFMELLISKNVNEYLSQDSVEVVGAVIGLGKTIVDMYGSSTSEMSSPFTLYDRLACFDQGDRLIVYEIEARLKGVKLSPRDIGVWCYLTQIIAECPIVSAEMLWRAPLGMRQQIDASKFFKSPNDLSVCVDEMWTAFYEFIAGGAIVMESEGSFSFYGKTCGVSLTFDDRIAQVKRVDAVERFPMFRDESSLYYSLASYRDNDKYQIQKFR